MTLHQSESVSTDLRVAVCACCSGHEPLLWNQIVTCRECGCPCSCEGCVAEHDAEESRP